MSQTHPGNEPDADDMSHDPDVAPVTPDLPDEEAETLGDFA